MFDGLGVGIVCGDHKWKAGWVKQELGEQSFFFDCVVEDDREEFLS